MATQDQVVWASVNIMTGGQPVSYTRGALLPDAASGEETDYRALLRIGGAIRTVEVVFTPDELAAQAQVHAEATATRAVSADVDPGLPMGDQLPGTAPAGAPTLETAGQTPVVVGPKGRGRPAGKE